MSGYYHVFETNYSYGHGQEAGYADENMNTPTSYSKDLITSKLF